MKKKHPFAFSCLAAVIALAGCASSSTKPTSSTTSPSTTTAHAVRTPSPLEGVWRSDGYGYLVSVKSGKATMYQTTKVSCFADPIRTQEGTAATDGSISFSIFGQTTAAFTSKTKDTAGLLQDSSLGEVFFNRIDRLPEQCDAPVKADPVAAFDIFYNTYVEHYPFFEQRKADWSAIRDTFRSKVASTTTDEELAAIFADMIRPLGDAHTPLLLGEKQVYEGLRTGSPITKGEEFEPLGARLATAVQRHLAVDVKTWANDYIAYGDLPDGLGYLRVASFNAYTKSGTATDDQAELNRALDEIFSSDRVGKLKGLIIDVRWNGGGSDELALQLAGRLSGKSYVAYAKRTRNDPADPKKFTKPQAFSVEPASGPKFTGPITLLTASLTISAGETFTQAMLGRTPAPIRIGGNTQGVFSDVLVRNLPGGSKVLFGLPNEEFVTAQGFSFDGTGIPPDICVPTFTETDLATGKDPAIAKARELLLSGVAPVAVDITKAPSSIC